MNLRKFLSCLLVFIFLVSQSLPVYAYVMSAKYLCELGLSFYQKGRISEALHEFQKALIISPGYEPALQGINMIEQLKPREQEIQEFLDRTEGKIPPFVGPSIEAPALREKESVLPRILSLDKNIKMLKFPLEIEQERSIIIKGENIRRFLATQPDVLSVERLNQDEVSVTGKNFGHTYLHIWDGRGRWTLEFLTMPKRPPGLTYDERRRREIERAGNLKLRYSMDWYSYEIGKRYHSMDRTSYSYSHYLGLTGATPYGQLNSFLTIRNLKNEADLTYLTLGITDGRFAQFRGFELRTFDFSPDIHNLIFPGRQLRGVMLESPAFNKKIDYTVFWGREGGGRYGGLSPGLAEGKHSFLSGFALDFSPIENQDYGFSVFRGWGRDREDYLTHYGYDLQADWNLGNWGLGYEIGYNSEIFAHLFNTEFRTPRLRLTTEFRDIDRDYTSMSGRGWQTGELGSLFTLNYRPTEKMSISSRLDVFRDRLYPSLDNENRWNTDFEWSTDYRLDRLTSLSLDYELYNDLGKLSQYRFHGFGLGLNRTWEWIKKFNTSINYRHQESKNFTSPSLDYINDKIMLGLSFNLIGDLYYYLNQDFNWLQERYNASRFKPQVLETGVSWSSQIFKTPLFANLRFYYHDEENADSTLSFLSGEDYIEGYSELSFRPTSDKEIYGSVRIRNVWAENPDVNKRFEADFNAGLRYVWDTGARWESIGAIEGYVFKDLNSDGLYQKGETPVEDIRLWLGKENTSITDSNGYYRFPSIRAQKAYVSLDTQSLPSGFVLTVPVIQAAMIAHHGTVRIDFGIVSRSEIYGIVFEDVDGNGKYSKDDKGIKEVRLILEDGSSVITDDDGRYRFAKINPGEHALSLDLNTLPVDYLPLAAVKKEMTVFEGMSYNYNIPCQRQSQP